ncbi:MAG: protein kinase [Bacteroidetes bacterium]|nr:protein kinase [Bacteroidota bacterium]
MIGKTISHYKILEKLGEGGMGIVYKAEDTKLKREVAIKFLPRHISSNKEERQRFEIEAQAAAALNHPNITHIYAVEETDDEMFIVMEYIGGTELKKKIIAEPIPSDEVINITTQIAEGLAAAHNKGIIHRDIKSSNIMITNDEKVKIMDFGLAKIKGGSDVTKIGSTVGTTAYMSPEQAKGEVVDNRTDIWSLGVVLYEMITGKQPFQGDYEQAVLYSIMNEDPEPITALRTGVPMMLEQVANKTLEKDKELRYQSTGDLLADLKKISKEIEAGEKVPSQPKVPAKIDKTKKWKRVLISLAAVLSLVTVFLLLQPIFREEPLVSSPKSLAVMPFENKTGDESLDYLTEVIPNLLITNLEQSRFLNLITWERMRDLLNNMGKKDVKVLDIDKDVGFELCEIDGIHGIVLGSFTKAGDWFVTDLKVLDVETKKLLFGTNAKGKGVGSILESQIDELSKAVSWDITLPSSKFREEKFKVADVTTKSLEAYRYYLRGIKDYSKFFQADGIRNLEKAIELDSSFAMAHYYLARIYRQLQNTKAAKSAIERALFYSDKATEKERLYIKTEHASLAEGDLEKAISINEKLVNKYPKEKWAYFFLGLNYSSAGKTEEEIAAYNEALKLDAIWGDVLNAHGYSYLKIGDFNNAEKAFQKNASLNPDDSNVFDSLGELYFIMGMLNEAIVNFQLADEIYAGNWLTTLVQVGYIYAIQGNYTEALRQYKVYFSSDLIPEWAAWGYWHKARLKLLLGSYQEAISLLEEEITLADRRGVQDRKAQAHELMSFVHAEMGDFAKAENELQTCLKIRLKIAPERSLRWKLSDQCISGFFDVKEGKLVSAEEKLKAVKDMLPRLNHWSQEIYSYWSALLEGEIALANGLYANAIQKFRIAVPPGPLSISTWRLEVYRLPIVRDGLARVYYTNSDFDKAVAEYKRLITFDPKSKDRFLIEPQYHYRLGKLYEEKGLAGLAIQEYEKFLEIWKDANADLQVLIDAKERLAKLRTVSAID